MPGKSLNRFGVGPRYRGAHPRKEMVRLFHSTRTQKKRENAMSTIVTMEKAQAFAQHSTISDDNGSVLHGPVGVLTLLGFLTVWVKNRRRNPLGGDRKGIHCHLHWYKTVSANR